MNTRIWYSAQRRDLYEAVYYAVKMWPNAHLGSCTAREDIRSAFFRIKRDVKQGLSLDAAIDRVWADAHSHADI